MARKKNYELTSTEAAMRSVLIVKDLRRSGRETMRYYAHALKDRLGMSNATAFRYARKACDVLGFDPPPHEAWLRFQGIKESAPA